MSTNPKTFVALNVLAIITFVRMVINYFSGSSVLFEAVVILMAIAVTVGYAYVRAPIWMVLMWMVLTYILVLSGMGLFLPEIIKLLS